MRLLVELKGLNRPKKNTLNYQGLESARRLVPHREGVPVLEFGNLPATFMEYDVASDSGGSVFQSNAERPFKQELSDFIKNFIIP